MSDVFFEEMAIPKPRFRLDIGGLNHGAMTGRMLEQIESILVTEKPHAVIVYGDTNSTLAGALAAKKLHVPVAHVEAGLRSFNMDMPEEVNRILTDRISNWLYCPTEHATRNLSQEGFGQFKCEVVRSGDVMLDAFLHYRALAQDRSSVLKTLNLAAAPFTLATIHRAENTDNITKLGSIVAALNQLHQDCEVVCPLHPRTRKVAESAGLELKFRVLDPVGYFDMIQLLCASQCVITDSGGVQKEAFFADKPCITLREETEWLELVECGVNRLVGSDVDKILEAYATFQRQKPDFSVKLYGDGHAAEQIAEHLIGCLK